MEKRWRTPYEWLTHKIDRDGINVAWLVQRFRDLAREAGPEAIEAVFKNEMNADGYYLPASISILGRVKNQYRGQSQWEVMYQDRHMFMTAAEILDLLMRGVKLERE